MCRLLITFLAFDVFFVIICVVVAFIVGVAVCCCLPCIIAILYAVADQVLHYVNVVVLLLNAVLHFMICTIFSTAVW